MKITAQKNKKNKQNILSTCIHITITVKVVRHPAKKEIQSDYVKEIESDLE